MRQDRQKPCILVLGMHRSGTSLLSGLLGMLGFEHSDRLMPPNFANPTGFWEPVKVVNLNNRLLALNHHFWAEPRPLHSTFQSKEEDALKHEATQLVADEVGAKDSLVLKDPRMARLLPFWLPILEQSSLAPTAILTCRNPLETAASLKARDNVEVEHALALWLSHLIDAEHHSRHLPRTCVLYDRLLSAPTEELQKALQHTGLTSPHSPASVSTQLAEFSDQGAQHHRFAASDIPQDTTAGKLAARMFDQLSSDQQLLETDAFDEIAEAWRSHCERHFEATEPSDWVVQMADWQHHLAQGYRNNPKTLYQALAAASEAVKRAPNLAHYRCLLAEIALQVSSPRLAADEAQAAINLGGGTPRAYAALCAACEQLGDVSRAIEAVQGGLHNAPGTRWLKKQLEALQTAEQGDQ